MAALTAAVAVGVGGALISGSRQRAASSKAQKRQIAAQERASRTVTEGAEIGQRAIEAGRAGGRRDLIQARDRARGFLEPFAEFGTGQIGALGDILTPGGQAEFLQDNPIFQAALRNK